MFQYQHGILYCENCALPEIAGEVGTPFYLYSQTELERRAQAYLILPEALTCFAVKANGNPALLRLLGAMGIGADVTSGGELFLALRAGIPANRIIYSGVGKREDEIRFALEAGVRALHVESEPELTAIALIAKDLAKRAPVAVRVNPDIQAETHPYDSTGRLEHKFGVPRDIAITILRRSAAHPQLDPVGLAAHIGSQITSTAPYEHLAFFLVELAKEAKSLGIDLTYLDVGGGLGIDYNENDAPTIEEWVKTVAEPVSKAGYQLVVEPGRSIVGPTGVLVTKVLYTKVQGGHSFVIVDAGMNDLLRPALYNAVHPLRPLRRQAQHKRPTVLVDVVGPICESGDFLARNYPLQKVYAGELLAVMQAGAYGFAMGSNYNGRLRPAEVLVKGDRFQVIRRRQNYDHLLDGIEP